MSSKTTWVRFKLAGASFGFAHHIGEVAELSEKDAEKLTEAGATVPAKPAEIEAAKAAIAAEIEADAAKNAKLIDPEKVAMAKQIAELEAKLAAAAKK